MIWTLIIVLGGVFGDVKSVQTVSMTEPQCLTALQEMSVLKDRGMSAGCFGPDGKSVTFSDIE